MIDFRSFFFIWHVPNQHWRSIIQFKLLRNLASELTPVRKKITHSFNSKLSSQVARRNTCLRTGSAAGFSAGSVRVLQASFNCRFALDEGLESWKSGGGERIHKTVSCWSLGCRITCLAIVLNLASFPNTTFCSGLLSQ